MISLLGNRFAPVTFSFGFLELSLEHFTNEFEAWEKRLGRPVKSRVTICGGLSNALQSLQPLCTPHERFLFVGTTSPWTALFVNNRQFGDTHSPIAYLARHVGARGLCISAAEDTKDDRTQGGMYGSVKFSLYGPEQTERVNGNRAVGAYNDGGKWKFYAEGRALPFERTESYNARRIRDRFTSEMLVAYCAALGLAPFESSFYQNEAIIVTVNQQRPRGYTEETYEVAQRRRGITPEL